MAKDIETLIIEEGLTAPRITLEHIHSKVKNVEYHVFPTTCLTVCCLTLENGFTVTGESACASPENFNEMIGQKVAKDNAINKVRVLEGYLLKQKLHESKQ